MFLSCIIPTFNRASTLERAVNSVLAQTHTDFECLIVDDASTDETSFVLQRFSDPRIKKLKLEKNLGVSAARNRGAKMAAGQWLAFLDSDDEWLPHKLKAQLELMHSHPEYHLIHGEEIWIRNGVRVNQKKKHQKGGGDQFVRSLEQCLICPSTVVIRKSIFDDLQGFREDFEVCEDYDLWIRFLSRYPVGFITEPVLKKYGGHPDQLSTRFKAMDDWRLRSMFDLLASDGIGPEQAQALYDEICRKGQILSIGYDKHGRSGDRQRVESMVERAHYYLVNHLKESP
jgi:glycosyltransferase involved in cell wall biosynthesis